MSAPDYCWPCGPAPCVGECLADDAEHCAACDHCGEFRYPDDMWQCWSHGSIICDDCKELFGHGCDCFGEDG